MSDLKLYPSIVLRTLLLHVVLKADGLDKDENPPDMVRGSENGSERQNQSGKATAEPKMEKYKEL